MGVYRHPSIWRPANTKQHIKEGECVDGDLLAYASRANQRWGSMASCAAAADLCTIGSVTTTGLIAIRPLFKARGMYCVISIIVKLLWMREEMAMAPTIGLTETSEVDR